MGSFTNDLGIRIIKIIYGVDDYAIVEDSIKPHKIRYDVDGRPYIMRWHQKNYLDEFIRDSILVD